MNSVKDKSKSMRFEGDNIEDSLRGCQRWRLESIDRARSTVLWSVRPSRLAMEFLIALRGCERSPPRAVAGRQEGEDHSTPPAAPSTSTTGHRASASLRSRAAASLLPRMALGGNAESAASSRRRASAHGPLATRANARTTSPEAHENKGQSSKAPNGPAHFLLPPPQSAPARRLGLRASCSPALTTRTTPQDGSVFLPPN